MAQSSIDLITIGEAFHRLDQMAIIENSLDWLKPGGCIAILGTYSILAGGEAWKETVRTVAWHWMTRAFPAGWAEDQPGAAVRPDAFKLLLVSAGFTDVKISVLRGATRLDIGDGSVICDQPLFAPRGRSAICFRASKRA